MPKKPLEKKRKCDECKKRKKTQPVVLKKNDDELHVRFCKACTEKYENVGWKPIV